MAAGGGNNQEPSIAEQFTAGSQPCGRFDEVFQNFRQQYAIEAPRTKGRLGDVPADKADAAG